MKHYSIQLIKYTEGRDEKMDISPDLKVTEPTVTMISNTFVRIENYLSIVTYDTNLIKIKTKIKKYQFLYF